MFFVFVSKHVRVEKVQLCFQSLPMCLCFLALVFTEVVVFHSNFEEKTIFRVVSVVGPRQQAQPSLLISYFTSCSKDCIIQ